MTRPTPASIRRAIVPTLLLSVMAFAVLMLAIPASQAAPSGNCTYYSSGSYTTVVGQYGYDCCNNVVAWGTKTKWSRCGGCFVCFPPPR
jgi:hypothetical protein